jgi:hypothetical protein
LNVGTSLQFSPYEIYHVEKCEALSTAVVHFSENSKQSNEGLIVPDNQFLEQREKVTLSLSLSQCTYNTNMLVFCSHPFAVFLLDSQVQELEVHAVNVRQEFLESMFNDAKIKRLFKLCGN